MPPWMPSTDHVEIIDARGMSDTDKAVVLKWLEAGCPVGEEPDKAAPSDSPGISGKPKRVDPSSADAASTTKDATSPQPEAHEKPSSRRVVMNGTWHTPAEGAGDMRSFVFPIENETPLMIQGLTYRCTAPRTVHTVTFVADDLGLGRQLDRISPEAGYDAMGDAKGDG